MGVRPDRAAKGFKGDVLLGSAGLPFRRAGANKPMMACTYCGYSFQVGSERNPLKMRMDAEVSQGAVWVLVVFLSIIALLVAGGNG
ncbi:hypothetical protein BI364_07740 [Acidihalobacter yilgarnensis]|uniref:Uncharacterized protein n=1 Tax=Acidihalobacter yilgarnensis TaxID=2819280 RepID=A0A1D8IN22_9GAMM|nr:hypothetical protein BI364_07740 [Acidihalobacter yilgarnensis]